MKPIKSTTASRYTIHYDTICLGIIFILAVFLRLYRLSSLPLGLYVDEAGLGYNAWCLANYGVDRYLNSYPIYAQNYMAGQSPLYTYATVLLVKLAGGNISVMLLRLPGFLFSMTAFIFGIKITKFCFSDKRILLGSAFLLAVCPYYVMQGRFALDCNAMFACCMVSLYLLLKYTRTGKLRHLILCGIAFGITMYSYAVSYIILAVFLTAAALYLLYTRRITWGRMLLWALCVCITALPVILFIFTILFDLPSFRFLFFTIAPVSASRASEISFQDFLPDVLTAIQQTVTSDLWLYDSLPKYGTLFYLSIPFILLGFLRCCRELVRSFRTREFHQDSLFVLFYLAMLVTAGVIERPNIYRMNAIYVSLHYFLVYGLFTACCFMHRYRKPFVLILSLAYGGWTISFCHYYFNVYCIENYPLPSFRPSAAEAVRYAEENLPFSTLYIDYAAIPEYNLIDFPVSPYEWQNQYAYSYYCCLTNENVPVEASGVYILRSENTSMASLLESSGIVFEKIDFSPQYVIYYSAS